MSARADNLLGPRSRALLGRVELRLALRTLVASSLLALSLLLLLAELSAAGSMLKWASISAAAGALSLALPALAVMATAGVLLTLLRRPGKIYLASLAEKVRPELAGSLVTLAEAGAGRGELPPGAAEILAERAEAELASSPLRAGEVARAERASRVPAACLAAAFGLGVLMVTVGGRPYLEALGEVAGGSARPAAIRPKASASAVVLRPQPAARVERITYRYPEYAGQPPRESDSPEIDCLAGATAELLISVRGEVGGVELRLLPGPTIAAERAGDGLWRARLPVVRVGAYVGLLRHPSGGATVEAFRGTITARADLPPSASALARELADGRLAVDYRLADDYRLGPARMAFTAGGRRMLYEVPDVAGRREAQGAVLVPAEVLAAAAGAGGVLRYRLEAADTHAPDANRTVSPELEYRKETKVASAGPLLEPGRTRPPAMAGSHGTNEASPGASSGGGGVSTRPLESLFKPDDDPDGSGRPPPSGGGESKPDDPYVAPSSGGGADGEKPPGQKKPGSEKTGGGEPGSSPGGAPGEQKMNTPQPGGGGPGGDSVNTPGRPSGGGSGGSGSGGAGGGAQHGEKPPTGNETGVGAPRPEQVIHEKVGMEFKPGESRRPGGVAPPPLHTGYGTERRVGNAPSGVAGAPDARAPDGTIRTGTPGHTEPLNAGSAAARSAPIPPQYRRYVEEYLNSLSERE